MFRLSFKSSSRPSRNRFKVIKVYSAFWEQIEANQSLQCILGSQNALSTLIILDLFFEGLKMI